MTKLLTKKQDKELIKILKGIDMNFYWDYRDELSKESIKQILQGKVNDVYNELWELNLDNIGDMEKSFIKEALENIDLDPEDFDIWDLRDEYLDYLCIDMDIKSLIRNTPAVNIRIELLSNFDCINSHYFETASGGGYSYNQSYMGDTIDALNLNPRKVRNMFVRRDVKCYGYWPDKENRDGKELISYDAFWQEEENRSCGVCLLTVLAKIDISDFIKGSPQIITIATGNQIGFFSDCEGGGSTMEAPLKKEFKINLDKGPRKKDSYSNWRIVLDEDSGYGVKEVFGSDNSIFGEEIVINKYKIKEII